MANRFRPHHPVDSAERLMRRDGRRERVDEAVRAAQRVEPVLSPQTGDPELVRLALNPRLDPADEPIAVQDRQDVVAPAPLCRHTRCAASGWVAGGDLPFGLGEDRHAFGRDVAFAADGLDRDGDERAGLDELRVQHLASGGRDRQVTLQPVDRTDPRRCPQSQLHSSGSPEQAVGSVPRQHLVPERLTRRHHLFEELRREQPLDVDYLAVSASHRGRGIGAALLRRSFAMLSERDIRRVLVSVDAQNPTGATAVYERVGMRIVNAWDQWERPTAGSR